MAALVAQQNTATIVTYHIIKDFFCTLTIILHKKLSPKLKPRKLVAAQYSQNMHDDFVVYSLPYD